MSINTDRVVDNFADKIELQIQKFQILIGNYRTALKQLYLEDNGDNTTNTENIERRLQKVYADTFLISSQINSDIMKNNGKIQSLDEYLNKLKQQVDAKNTELAEIRDSGLAAIPREHYIREHTIKSYFIAAYYITASSLALYFIVKYFKK